MRKGIKVLLFGALLTYSLAGCKNKDVVDNQETPATTIVEQEETKKEEPIIESPNIDVGEEIIENKDILVESFNFLKSSIEIDIHTTHNIEYEIKPDDATNKSVRWASSDYEIVSVDEAGQITALKDGNATITATTMDGSSITKTIDVTVNPIAINQLDLKENSKELDYGETYQIQPVIYPDNATYQGCSFVSNDESIAKVDESGNVTAIGKGETDIVISSEKYPEITIRFHVKCFSIKADKISHRLTDFEMKEGENYFFTPSVFPTTTSNKSFIYSNDNPEVVSVSESGEIYALAPGKATVVATSQSNPSLSTSLIITVKGNDERIKTRLAYTYKDFANNNMWNVDNANYKSTHCLIIPVWFTDSGNYISNSMKSVIRDDIEKAYLGTNAETGWRSVKTFYEEEGRGRYTLTGVVTDWYACNFSSRSFYNQKYAYDNVDTLVKSAVTWYKSQYNVSNMKGFDADCNGYIDSVVLIYGAPDYSALQNSRASALWAFTSWLCEEETRSYEDPGANAYFWASYDFMYGEKHPHCMNYHTGDTTYCNIDTHTFIHEFGHVLGLNDYYDYSGQYSPAGSFSMQDENVGGHDPYSLLTYGFVDPYVVTDETTTTINDFQSSGDVILLSNKEVNSPFDEYILLELYTPTGLNEFDSLHAYCGARDAGPKDVGIRIWHVDARLIYSKDENSFSSNKITTNPLIEGYKVWGMMSNTYTQADGGSMLGSKFLNYNELQLIRNDTSVNYKSTTHLESKYLFKQGDVFSIDKFANQFVNNKCLNNGSSLPFKVTVKEITNKTATITITK